MTLKRAKKDKEKEKEERLPAVDDASLAGEGSSSFSYEPDADALYRYYRDAYRKSAGLAMRDTVGQISALSGGYANSYAQSAGQSAYDREMSKMDAIIPSLYKLAYERYADELTRRDAERKWARDERRYEDELAQQAFENALGQRKLDDAETQRAWERAQSERAYADESARRAAEEEAKKAELEAKKAEEERARAAASVPHYDYFDERLFAGMGLSDAEKQILDDAGYRYMRTGNEKYLDQARDALAEARPGVDPGDYFDFVRENYFKTLPAEPAPSSSDGAEQDDKEKDEQPPKEMTASQMHTYLSNRESYAKAQEKNLLNTEPTRSFALYLRAQMHAGFFTDPVEEITEYVDRVIGMPDFTDAFSPGTLIGRVITGGYSDEQKKAYARLLDVFVTRGCIDKKTKEEILKNKMIL